MSDQYLSLVGGAQVEVEANNTSAGAGDAGKIIALDAAGKIDPSMLPANVNEPFQILVAFIALSPGSMVNIRSDGKVQLANATSSLTAVGFVLAASSVNSNATVFFEGLVTGLSGLTPGAKYYLDSTAGQITDVPVTASGRLHQVVGRAVSSTTLLFQPDEPIRNA